MYSLNILSWYEAKNERGWSEGRGRRVCRSGKDDGGEEEVGGTSVGRVEGGKNVDVDG